MIKVCYIIGQLIRGGTEKQLYELAKGINKEKFHPIVITLSEGGYWRKEIQRLGIQVIEIQRTKNRELARLLKLIKLLKAIKPDIVHTFLFPANSYGRIAAILTKVPIIIASERNAGELGKDKKKYMVYIDKLLSLFSNGIICNSFYCSNNLIDKYSYDSKKVFAVHNGISAEEFLKNKSLNKENKLAAKVVGTIGKLIPQKNQRLFLDMAQIILNMSKNKDIKFLIAGRGPLKDELINYSKKLEIENSVTFTGENTNIPDLLQTVDIFVTTSLYEGLPNVIMEAMLSGLPVVATEVGGVRELVIDGKTGFLCPSNSAKDLSCKVISLLNDENKAKQMGRYGQERILNEFENKMMVEKTENIYLKLMNPAL